MDSPAALNDTLNRIKDIFDNQIPFNRVLGLEVKSLAGRCPKIGFKMQEALIGYTRNGAYITFEEDLKGTLEPGKLADMIVLSDDLLTIDPERILDVQVETTILGGKVVYER